MLRWRAGQAQGDIGIPTAEVGKIIGCAELERQRRIVRHELRQRRQQQTLQDRIGTGQAHDAADHFSALLHTNARRLQSLFSALGLFSQGLRQGGGQVTGAAFFEQLLTQCTLQPAHRSKHRRNIHLQQLRCPGQRAAAYQREDQGQVRVVQSIVRRCIDHLGKRQY
ncbi:hypothetical protein D9M71_577060 [compost metagenome]